VGPHFGIESWVEKVRKFTEENLDDHDGFIEKTSRMLQDLRSKLPDGHRLIEEIEKFDWKSTFYRQFNIPAKDTQSKSDTSHTNKKFKLLVLGDSLVCGVGCDGPHSSPVLPHILARVLSFSLKADVEWHSAGIVGGTIGQIRENLLPIVRSKLLDSYSQDKENAELIVVVICGLNDWKGTIMVHRNI
jgi:hypothetical protein